MYLQILNAFLYNQKIHHVLHLHVIMAESVLKLVVMSSNAIASPDFLEELAGTVSTFTCNFIRKRPQHWCFPVKFAKFLTTAFLQNTFGGYSCFV